MYTNVSNAFIQKLNENGRTFIADIRTNGQSVRCDIRKIKYTGSCNGENHISLGTSGCSGVEVTVHKPGFTFGSTEYEILIGMELNGVQEYVPLGLFTAEKPTFDGEDVTVTMYDRMKRFEKSYFSSLTYPAPITSIVNEICTQCGVPYVSFSSSIAIEDNPAGYTCREMITYIAQLLGRFAIVNRSGYLEFKWYHTANYTLPASRFWDPFTRSEFNCSVHRICVVIGKEKNAANQEVDKTVSAGNGAKGIVFANPFYTQSIVESVYQDLAGFTFRPASVDAMGDLRLELGDVITITDRDSNSYTVPIMSLTFEYTGALSMSLSAVGEEEQKDDFSVKGPTTQAIERMQAQLILADSLYANKVVVDNLEANYARITSLLAGNAAATQADLIQLNAQNAVIDTAFLKNIISNNITVNDLLAGTIYTNKFRVMSPDGAFDLNGKLMQFKDSNNTVRIQIGQDGQGNYNYYLANANGEIIWDASGITANGVPDGLIVDDMVADSSQTYQGISASKLNISSMVGALNEAGGLRSTAIYLDDQAQTLNVAFSQMSQDVQTIGGTASAASSAASQAVTTAQNAEATAQNALAVLSGISTLDALGASLTNDAHVVHTLVDGTGGNYTDAWTKVTIYLGDTDVSSDTHFTVTASSGVIGTWNPVTRIYQVTNLTTDNGYVDFDCLYGTGERYLVSRQGNRYTLGGNHLMINSGGSHIAKRFSISKAPDGRVGISYDLQVSAVAITRDVGESSVSFTPSAIVARALRNDNGTVSSYNGVFLIEESADGSTYVQKYRSSSAESQKTYVPSANANLKSIRVTLLDATGVYTYDYQTIAVIADADALKANLTSLAGTVGTVQESVQTNATHISQLETSAQGFSQSISDLETSVRGLSDGNLVVNWRHTDNGDGTATVVCNVYKEGHDIANTFPENWFRYVKRTESGSQLLKFGRTITVNLSDYMYGGTLEGQFMTCEDWYLTTRSGAKLTTRSGKYLTIYKETA